MDQQLELIAPDALIPPAAPVQAPSYRGYRRIFKDGEFVALLPPREKPMNHLQRTEFRLNGWREEVIE